MSFTRNSHSWPERSLSRGAPIRRLIQIYLADEDQLTWNVWLCASEDRTSGLHWKREFLRTAEPIGQISSDLEQLLTDALQILEGWSEEDLEPATKR